MFIFDAWTLKKESNMLFSMSIEQIECGKLIILVLKFVVLQVPLQGAAKKHTSNKRQKWDIWPLITGNSHPVVCFIMVWTQTRL